MTHKTIHIFGIPMDLGQKRRGVDMGSSALRYAGLDERLRGLGYTVRDNGNVTAPQLEEVPDSFSAKVNAHYLPQNAAVCQAAYERIVQCLHPDEQAVFIGGDHSMSIGTVSAVASQGEIGVIWVDAHGDFNTPETSPSGNIHGMALAALVGDGPEALVNLGHDGPKLRPQNIAMIGIRDLDAQERVRLMQSGIKVFTMRDIDEHGMYSVAQQLLAHLSHVERLHVSLDLDACDPRIAPGVGTPVMGGLTYREAHLLMEILSDSGKVRTLDVVEINPILDKANRTAKTAVELVCSLLGQRIL